MSSEQGYCDGPARDVAYQRLHRFIEECRQGVSTCPSGGEDQLAIMTDHLGSTALSRH